MQSELQSYIQQQPPPVQSQQVIEQSQMPQSMNYYYILKIINAIIHFYLSFLFFIAQFQTMNIGTLGQPNVVTIQHQGRVYTSTVCGY